MKTVADAAILGATGIVPLAVTTNFSTTFLRRPSPDRAIVAEATILELGGRLAVADVRVYSKGEPAPVAQVTTTYSTPPR